MAAKYIVGIDLGTTNSALARCEVVAEDEQSRIEIHAIPQLVNPDEVAARTLLPSFLYLPGELDFPAAAWRCPGMRRRGTWSANWRASAARRTRRARRVGQIVALVRAARTAPRRSCRGARRTKCRSSRRSTRRRSTCNTCATRGTHVTGGRSTLALTQDVLLTVPASFDEEARELTRARGASRPGSQHVTLLEEPQAAFYAWLDSQGDALAPARRASATSSWSATSAAAPPTSA